MSPVLMLTPAQLSDVPALINVYMRAFTQPISLATFPRVPSVHSWWEARIAKAFEIEPGARFIMVTNAEDEIIAFAKWVVPVPGGESDVAEALPEWPEGSDRKLCDAFYGGLARERKRIMGNRSHYYLDLLATLPEYQGKGAAGQLIRWGLEQADRDGLEAYVDASPAAKAIYERYGWVTAGTVEIHELEHTDFCMRRSPAVGMTGVK